MQAGTAKFYNWALTKAASDKAPFWLTLLFGLEIILFLPLDALLVFFCLQRKNLIPLYVVLAATASVISGLIGYFLGHFLWDLIQGYVIPHLITPATFDRLADHLDKYEHWAIFFGTLLPFPLKALSLASGVFKLGAASFALYMGLARLVRFGLIGAAMALWGEKVKTFLDKNFHSFMLIIATKIALVTLGVYFLAK